MVPLGLPGLWVMILGLLGYGWFTDFQTVGLWTTTLVLALALLGELIETWLGFRFARRYGALKRAAWGALIGGLVGAVVGSFAGAAVFEYTVSAHTGAAVAAGWGAMRGRSRGEDCPRDRDRRDQRHRRPAPHRGERLAASAGSVCRRA